MTAVEFLIDRICGGHVGPWLTEIEQAKALERQRIINAYSHGWHDGQDVIIQKLREINHVGKGGDKAGEQYFNDMKGTDL